MCNPAALSLRLAIVYHFWYYYVPEQRKGNRIVRVIFCIARDQMILLNGFIKKSRKTPKSDLNLAIERKRTLER